MNVVPDSQQIILDDRRRAAAARRALENREEAKELVQRAEALERKADLLGRTWSFEPGWNPDA